MIVTLKADDVSILFDGKRTVGIVSLSGTAETIWFRKTHLE